jgi:hypothetical protein
MDGNWRVPSLLAATPSPRNRRLWSGAIVSLATVLVAALLLAPGSTPGLRSSGITSSAAIPPWNNWTCNPNNLSPTAVAIPTTNIGPSRPAGAVIGASYEFKVVNYTKADKGVVVYLPTAMAVFPTSNGTLTLTIAPRNLSIANGSWLSPSTLTASKTLTFRETWSKSNAYLSTAKYAVMAAAASGSLTLEFRWRWSVTPAGGGAVDNGRWTVPSLSSTTGFLPSIFYPAPLVTLGPVSFQGTTMTLPLGGWVANTSFRLVLEYPSNGTEIQSIWENTSGAPTFNATLPITYRDGVTLPNGTYLAHVHDVCEAIVHMTAVKVSTGVPMARVSVG